MAHTERYRLAFVGTPSLDRNLKNETANSDLDSSRVSSRRELEFQLRTLKQSQLSLIYMHGRSRQDRASCEEQIAAVQKNIEKVEEDLKFYFAGRGSGTAGD